VAFFNDYFIAVKEGIEELIGLEAAAREKGDKALADYYAYEIKVYYETHVDIMHQLIPAMNDMALSLSEMQGTDGLKDTIWRMQRMLKDHIKETETGLEKYVQKLSGL